MCAYKVHNLPNVLIEYLTCLSFLIAVGDGEL